MAKSYIRCGDCLELMKDIPDNSVDFVFTDIPYGEVNRKSNGLRNLDKGKADEETFCLREFLPKVYRIVKNSVCIFCGREQFSEIYSFFCKKEGTVRPIVWEKSNPSPMNGQNVYLSGVEFAVWFKKKGRKTFNAHCKNTVFKYPCGKSKLHPTEKNHNLIKEIILDNTNEGDLVCDPCMGSGSTGVVCIRTKRNFIGFEKDKNYFLISRQRLKEERKLFNN